ncbi:DNA polymerase III subunit alpha [Terrihalobacillus insolitus]|uniref:DNA polymerase III subunit alpha n=1 Tax=Terrihalobacillus insolitus TaxID=2950438 RepID=UPI0023423E3E|nr:DNA polymerase III subunit alpha [Terrihalobacillus insolitus]MDC3412639.1 DNA polymerase III subunit alpha [Terrihalobacillus insolitus]
MGYTHLQVRSGYSLMKSSITIEKLVEKAKSLGFDALAITDENVLHGAIPFYQACLKAGMKPIIGMAVNVSDNESEKASFILLAKNNRGYKNLLKLSSYIQLKQLDWINRDDLAQYTGGIIGILLVESTPIPAYLGKDEKEKARAYVSEWKNIYKERDFYLGVQDHGQETERQSQQIVNHNQSQLDAPVVAINDVRYLEPTDHLAFDCLQAIRNGEKWSRSAANASTKNKYLKSEEEMVSMYGGFWPELLENTMEIAKKCTLNLDLGKRMIPSYPVPTGETADTFLEKLCRESLVTTYDNKMSTEIEERLTSELTVIKKMKFSDYFLIVWDFILFAKKQRIIVGPGRGSAAGSLVAYLLGITEVDPVKYGLLFERFLNPERITMPDIDVDFSDHRRDEVIQYVKNKYGFEHVAQIITYGTFAARSVLRELIKTMEIDKQDAAFILKEIPNHASNSIVQSVKASDALTSYVKQSEKLQRLFKIATKLEGLPRHVSTHAAGVVISQEPLVENVPLTVGHNDVALTQFAMNELEAIGLLKMDFLGLRNLTLLEQVVSAIAKNENKRLDIKNIPFDDRNTFAILQEGRTNGIFQLESQGMQGVLRSLLPSDFEDIVAVNALYRPGPMEYIPVYIKRKHGQEAITYPHPDLKPILGKTYGVLVYQEQIMQIANMMAGFSLGQADILRRAVSKKQKEKMHEQRENFIAGCLTNGYEESVAEEVFDWIVRFSNYGFNRSHAVAYSMIAFQLAYLKAHYPTYFLAELMSSLASQEDKVRMYVKEAKELGIEMLAPSINRSSGRFTVENKRIRMGLSSIKGVGMQAVSEIIRARKEGSFKHIFDFCLRVSAKIVNRSVMESLILAGAFDETYPNRASLMATIDQAMEQGELFREFEDQPSLFMSDIQLDVSYVEMEPFTPMKYLSFEKSVLGLYVSSHPLSDYRGKLRASGYLALADSKKFLQQRNQKSAAVVLEIKAIRTKRGDPMAFLILGDESNEVDAVLFPELYRNVHRWLKEEMLVLFTGKIEQRNGRLQWVLSEIIPFEKEEIEQQNKQKLFIKVMEQNDRDVLVDLKQIAAEIPGETPVIIYHEKTKSAYQLSGDYNVKLTKTCLNHLYHAFGKSNVVIRNS